MRFPRRRDRTAERGATLVLNLMAMAAFALLAAAVYASSGALARSAGNDTRQAEALSIAEAGLEDAMQSLYRNAEWRTGFSSKTFSSGFYTVSLTTGTPPFITSTGYSRSVPFYGRAARTVSAQTAFTSGACPYAILADDVEIEGKLDAYDPSTTLTPCSTCFVNGADVWANDSMKFSGAACPPARSRGLVSIGGGNSLTGSAACAEDGVALSTTSVTVPNFTGPTGSNFTVNSTTTLTAGTYYFKNVTINSVLKLDTSTGTVYLNFDANFKANSGCQITNSSKIPSRVHISDVSGNSGHQIWLRCNSALHAYLEGNANKFEISQEVYGHYCGGSVAVSSSTANGIGRVHYDIGGGLVSKVALRTDASGWTQSYKRR